MPPPLGIRGAFRALSIRPRPSLQRVEPRIAAATRGFADNTTSIPPRLPEQNANAAGLPDSMLRPSESKEPAAEAGESESGAVTKSENEVALNQLQMVAYGLNPYDSAVEGHKYGLPNLPIPSQMHMKHRYDAVVSQVTRLLMQDGKLSKAQRHMAVILNYLRTSPTPKLNPARPLLPGHPPAEHLPLDPVLYLTLAIDSVAPLVRIRSYKGLAGGGASLDVPMPLAARQRRRMAFQWILDVVEKKKSKGSGRDMFGHKVAEEIVAVVEGRSSVWDKRQLLHRQGTSARANMNNPRLRNQGRK